jgi:inner membrane transporter RhtA
MHQLRSLPWLRQTTPAMAALLAVLAMLSVQTGAAVSTWLFTTFGPTGTAWLRLCWAALFLVPLARPKLWGRRRTDLAVVVMLGIASGLMTVLYFQAVHRLPLGTATALEFLGPLAVAMAGLRRLSAIVWPLAAAAGVLALTQPGTSAVDPVGVLFALGAGAGWACYILLTQRVGDRFEGLQGLALSMSVATVCVAPLADLPRVGGALDAHSLAVSAAAALLLPILPYAFEMRALRGLTTTAFGTLMSLEPAMGTLIGFVVLHQVPDVIQLLGIGLVTIAGFGATRHGARTIADSNVHPANVL